MDLKDYIRSIQDYPKKGILFRDITTLIKNEKAFKEPTAETDTISVTPSCFNASILALKFIFEGFIK